MVYLCWINIPSIKLFSVDFPVGGLMTFSELPFDDDYNLTYQEIVFNNEYWTDFSYYETYKESEFIINQNLTKYVSLTPAHNDFPIKVVESNYLDPIQGATVKLHRVNYLSEYEELTLPTDADGMVTFVELEYDYNWSYEISCSGYETATGELTYEHYYSYVYDDLYWIKLTPLEGP